MSDYSQSTPSSQDPLWHPDRALKRMGGDQGLLVNLIGYFLEDAPELIEKLTTAIQINDSAEATRFAHSLKGLCANYEASAAVDRAQQIESFCREGDLTAATAQLDDLRRRVDELGGALQSWQAGRA